MRRNGRDERLRHAMSHVILWAKYPAVSNDDGHKYAIAVPIASRYFPR